jgi:hypothetical protein
VLAELPTAQNVLSTNASFKEFTRLSGGLVKKTEMGRRCRMYGGEERCIQGFSGGS